jgi:hypothetical protein
VVAWWSCSFTAGGVRIVHVGGKVQRSHGGRKPWVGVHGVVVILVLVWFGVAPRAGLVARILGAGSSVTGGKVLVHFQVVALRSRRGARL